MGCFFACFSICKNKKPHQLVDGTSPNDQKCEAIEVTVSIKKEHYEIPLNSITLKKEKLGDLLNRNGKKVTFDLNVKCDEEIPVESSNKVEENNERKGSVLDLTTCSNAGCNTQNNRYENCKGSEEELDDLELEVSESDDESDGGKTKNQPQFVMEESSESLFSLSIESRKHDFDQVESGEKEVTSPIPIEKSPIIEVKPDRNGNDRSGQFVESSVLNPVENLAQWKNVRAKPNTPFKHEEKENINIEQESDVKISRQPSFKFSTFNSTPCLNGKKSVGEEPAVDTSLSSWLAEAENTPNSRDSSNSVSKKTNSPRNHEDETPIIGTVGSYWSHTGQTIEI